MLAAVPLLLAFVLFRRRAHTGVLWWTGVALFVVFLPNAPYVLTGHPALRVRRRPVHGRASSMVRYAVLFTGGMAAYVIAMWRCTRFMISRGVAVVGVVAVNAVACALCSVGVYLGRGAPLQQLGRRAHAGVGRARRTFHALSSRRRARGHREGVRGDRDRRARRHRAARRGRRPSPSPAVRVTLPVPPPVSPMLAKLARELPRRAGDFLYEPKWDGFRAIVFRDGDDVEIGSRNEKPLTRYFPELVEPLRAAAARALRRRRRDRDRHRARPRLRPAVAADPSRRRAASRCSRRRRRPRSSAFDLLAEGDDDLRERPFRERRARLERALADDAAAGAPHAGDHRPRRWRRSGSSASRAPASTAWSPSRSTASTARASARC